MAEQEKILDHLTEVFRDMESHLNGKSGSPLHDIQKKSFATLHQVQFPDRKHEDWKYTSAQRLISPKYKLARHSAESHVTDIPGFDSYIIPVINGKIAMDLVDPVLKSKGITITLWPEALVHPAWKDLFGKRVTGTNASSSRAFELLNLSFSSNGFFLDIPKNLVLEKPIELRVIHDDPEISFSHPLYFIRAGADSHITFFERFESNNAPSVSSPDALINLLGYMHLDQNASVRHIKWQNITETQNLVYKLLVSQQKDSRFESLAFDFGGSTIRNNIEISLEEINTYTSLQAGYLAKGRQSMDHQTVIQHKVPQGESHELYKGIIDGQASAAFNGKVYVHPDAQKTNAFQKNDTLVLSPHAIMNSKPQLEIFADDVKCSHGATIGQLDEKAMFYLKTRGLDSNMAKHILKTAFLAAVVDLIPYEPIRQYIRTGMSIDV